MHFTLTHNSENILPQDIFIPHIQHSTAQNILSEDHVHLCVTYK